MKGLRGTYAPRVRMLRGIDPARFDESQRNRGCTMRKRDPANAHFTIFGGRLLEMTTCTAIQQTIRRDKTSRGRLKRLLLKAADG